jgi:hypothetical protein
MRKLLTLLIFFGIFLCCIQSAGAAVQHSGITIKQPITLPTTTLQRDGVGVTTVTTVVPAVGDLAISSVPAGMSVILDGQTLGITTYFARSLSEGSHSLTLRLTGYQDSVDTVIITRATLTQKSYTLVPAAPAAAVSGKGLLSIDSTPSGTVILIDRGNYGTTPLTRRPVVTGSQYHLQ